MKATLFVALGVAAAMAFAVANSANADSYYDSRGNHVGSSSTDSQGTTRYYNNRGSHVGTQYR